VRASKNGKAASVYSSRTKPEDNESTKIKLIALK
jgi:hypothetical protein